MSEPTVRQRHVQMAYCSSVRVTLRRQGMYGMRGDFQHARIKKKREREIRSSLFTSVGQIFSLQLREYQEPSDICQMICNVFQRSALKAHLSIGKSIRYHISQSVVHCSKKVFLSYTLRLQIVRWGNVATRPTCLKSTKTWQPSVGEVLSPRCIASRWSRSRICSCYSCQASAESGSVYQGVWEKNAIGWFQPLRIRQI